MFCFIMAMGMNHEQTAIKPSLTARQEHPKQECRLSATVNQCVEFVFAYLRHVGD